MDLPVVASSPAPNRIDVTWSDDGSTSSSFRRGNPSSRFVVSVSDETRQREWTMTSSDRGQRSVRLDTAIFDVRSRLVVTVSQYSLVSASGSQTRSGKIVRVGSTSMSEALGRARISRRPTRQSTHTAVVTDDMVSEREDAEDGCGICSCFQALFRGLANLFRSEDTSLVREIADIPAVTTTTVVVVDVPSECDDDPSVVRLNDTDVSIYGLTLKCHLNDSTRYLTATLLWTWADNWQTVNLWQVILVNLSWIQADCCTYHQWIFELDAEQRGFQLPLFFRPGNRYRVTVRGLRRQQQSRCNSGDSLDNFVVVCKSSQEFRTGEVHSKSDVERLLDNARKSVQRNNGNHRSPCSWFYRNKDRQYFDRILNEHGGLMKPLLKDASGDSRSPINGEISGLFFSANARRGQPLPKSPFGDTRILIGAGEMLRITPNLYFADFYCMKDRGPHYVTLVLTKSGSEADSLCRERLPRLELGNPRQNPFLYIQNCELFVATPCLVEVFLTEPINIKQTNGAGLSAFAYGIEVIGRGSSMQGGVRKTASCGNCNLYVGRDVHVAMPSYCYEQF